MPETRFKIPLAVKIAYTSFMAVLIPIYWINYGPQNFLNFCDVALLVTLAGIWLESPLLIGTQATGIIIPQTLWLVDIVCHLTGFKLLGMTDYMFNPGYPLFTRLLSTFHGWLPLLLIWLVRRIGYDRRALPLQTVIGVMLLAICYACFDPPGTPGSSRAFNLNYVFGWSEGARQTKFQPLVWLAILIVGIPSLIYLPTHLLMCWWAGRGSGTGLKAGSPILPVSPSSANPADQSPVEPSPAS